MSETKRTRRKVDYIDKKEFSDSVESYVKKSKLVVDKGGEPPVIPDDIAIGFMLICEHLSHLRNFRNYTYREDMVMDAVENCVKAVHSFNPNAQTKSGKPNAFAYFTQIAYYAMIRRIQKENKDVKVKEKIMSRATPLDFIDYGDEVSNHYIENIISYNIKD